MLQVIQVGYSFVSERYTYIPYFGLFYILGQGISGVLNGKARYITSTLLIIFLAFLSVLTWNRIKVWKNGYSLISDTIKKNPAMFYSYLMRAEFKNVAGDMKGALDDTNYALTLNPVCTKAYAIKGLLFTI